jgi:hypothetical protein
MKQDDSTMKAHRLSLMMLVVLWQSLWLSPHCEGFVLSRDLERPPKAEEILLLANAPPDSYRATGLKYIWTVEREDIVRFLSSGNFLSTASAGAPSLFSIGRYDDYGESEQFTEGVLWTREGKFYFWKASPRLLFLRSNNNETGWFVLTSGLQRPGNAAPIRSPAIQRKELEPPKADEIIMYSNGKYLDGRPKRGLSLAEIKDLLRTATITTPRIGKNDTYDSWNCMSYGQFATKDNRVFFCVLWKWGHLQLLDEEGNSCHLLVHNSAVRAISSTDREIASEAASLLLRVGRLHDDEPFSRALTARDLGSLRANPETVIPALLQVAEQDQDFEVRINAVQAIGRFGTNALSVKSRLEVIAATDSDPRVRRIASMAMQAAEGKIAPEEIQ